VATGYFPPHLEFDFQELATVVSVLNEQRKEINNANKRKR
jgi:hypothetical protein